MRPFVYINVAMTADGKISFAHRRFTPFTGPHDHERLLWLRTQADAVMAGARTVDLYPVNMGPGPAKYRLLRRENGRAEYNLRVVVSGSGTLNPNAEIFRHRFSPIIVITTARGQRRLKKAREAGAEILVCGDSAVDFSYALRQLRKQWDVKRLLCEGGGEINAALFRHGLVDELYLTIAPVIFGGSEAPTLADGPGVASLGEATRLRLKSRTTVGNDLYLVYKVQS